MKVTCNIEIKSGKLIIQNEKKLLKEISELKDFSGRLTIEKKKSKRSDNQNRFYWSGVLEAAKAGFMDAGYSFTKEEIHEVFKNRFLEGKEFVNEGTGEILKVGATTTGLTKSEFSDYISEIKAFSIEWLNTTIPEASEQTSLNWIE